MLGKTKLHTIEVVIYKSLIDSYISHDKLVSVNNVLREYNVIYKRHSIETIVDNDAILWLNEKHIEERLEHKSLREVTERRKHRS